MALKGMGRMKTRLERGGKRPKPSRGHGRIINTRDKIPKEITHLGWVFQKNIPTMQKETRPSEAILREGSGKNKRMRSLKRMIKMPPKAQREIFSESFLDTDLRVKKSTNSKRNLIKKSEVITW